MLLHAKKFVVVLLGAVLVAMGMNFFLIPANVYSSGFTGISQLVNTIMSDYAPFTIPTGVVLLVLNIPVAILGWMKVGKTFTFYSFISVLAMSFFLEVIPVHQVSENILLNAVFGGVVGALGIGWTLKWGASTGGLDIVALVISRLADKPIGSYIFLLNAVIIITAGLLYGWEKALYTLVALYVSTRVIDTIHTRYSKLTAMIITKQGDALREAIKAKLVRGMTTIAVNGGFTNESKEMIMIVLTRYELFELSQLIHKIDPQAFTNIVETTEVLGLFRKE